MECTDEPAMPKISQRPMSRHAAMSIRVFISRDFSMSRTQAERTCVRPIPQAAVARQRLTISLNESRICYSAFRAVLSVPNR